PGQLLELRLGEPRRESSLAKPRAEVTPLLHVVAPRRSLGCPPGTLAHAVADCRTSVRPRGSGCRRGRHVPAPTSSLDLDRRADGLELLLRLVGLLLGDLLEDGLRGAVDQVLRLLEPEARERADLLDDLDLLVSGRGEDHVELGLLLRFLAAR